MPAPTFTYAYEPATKPRDWIRIEIQDTDSKAPLLADQEIEFCIIQEIGATSASEPDMLRAAARALEVLSRRWAAQADTVIGSLHALYSKTAVVYAQRATELRVRAAGMHAFFVGGQSEEGKFHLEALPDRVDPSFTRSQFLNPWRATPFGPGPVFLREGPI